MKHCFNWLFSSGSLPSAAPQAMFVTEAIMDHLAEAAKLPREVMQRMNLYPANSQTHFGQK
jgi:hypothetical protein